MTAQHTTHVSVTALAQGDEAQLQQWLSTERASNSLNKIVNIFLEAARAGHINLCRVIIDSGRLPDDVLAQTLDPVCHSGQLSVAQQIVRRCSIDTQYLHDALTGACTRGLTEVVTWLLSEMELSHNDRVSWLMATASARGDIDTVRLLAAQAATKLSTGPSCHSQALRTACYRGRVKVVDWLMTHTTADVGLCGKLDSNIGTATSLAAASYQGHADIVMTLLECVTPHTVNIQCGRYSDSALHFIIWYDDKHILSCKLLLACLGHGNKEADDEEAVNTLLRSPQCDVNVQDNNGLTPLHWACTIGNTTIVQSLLSVFADINITDDNRDTPVYVAKLYGNSELVPCFAPLLVSTTGNCVNSATSATVTQAPVVVSDVNVSDVLTSTLRTGGNQAQPYHHNNQYTAVIRSKHGKRIV